MAKISRNSKTTAAARNGASRQQATKRDQLIQLLRRRSGHDIAALSSKLGWQFHTTRAALSRLRQAGYSIEKLPRGKNGGVRYRITIAAGAPTP